MSRTRLPSRLMLSAPRAAETLSLRILRSHNLFLFHLVLSAASVAFLILLNLMIDGLETPWSLIVLVAWSLGLVGHWGFAALGPRRRLEREHEQLCEAWKSPEEGPGRGLAEIRELRDQVLSRAEAAREALRPISPEATADVSRGEAKALDLVAWLDEAEPLLARSLADRSRRREVAETLSKPLPEIDRRPLERLLTQLDLMDVKIAVLERETSRRRSVLESFLLVLESAGVAGSRTEVLMAVSDPLRGRVRLLEEAVRTDVVGATVGDYRTGATERIHEEVRLARELQTSILPQRAPEVPGLQVAHLYRPSHEVGGDFFDFYRTAPQRLLVAVGDASGHGLDSSMMSSMMKSALYTHVAAHRGLDESMVALNRMMCDTVGRRRLMTLVLLEIDVELGRLSCANAGHVFPLVVAETGVRELEQSSYPLGVRREVDYPVFEQRLEPGDRIVLVTDGCIEALDAEGEVYGWERLGARLTALAGTDPETMVEGLAEDLWKHLGGKFPQDDVTLVVVAFEPSERSPA